MKINMSHGNGGTETSKLIREVFLRHFANEAGTAEEDAAVLSVGGSIAFTTDSFVVAPAFFVGGDIGRVAVCGTVNDLLTSGAAPKYLSAGFIIGQGIDINALERIARSMRAAADEAGVLIVTGDTKVIEGTGEIYINTSGIGEISGERVSFKSAREDDALIVTGTLGDHHACVMSARMNIENHIQSDAAPLVGIVAALIQSGLPVHGIRDITRGGLATCLNEIAALCGLRARIYEQKIPVKPEVAGLCDILGLDPLYMANEGKMLIAVPADAADAAIEIIQHCDYGQNAAVIGELAPGEGVVMSTAFGGVRRIAPLSGEALPRIC